MDSGVTLAAVLALLRDIAPAGSEIRSAAITQTLEHPARCCADSPGRSMQRNDYAPLLVFDLDGTILRINSFPAWVLFLIAGPMPGLSARRRVLLSLRTQFWLLLRKLHAIGNDKLVHALQRAVAADGRVAGRGTDAL